ncbi:MAG: hypothetical protein CL681_16335 [Blastopirellula sp.]|mgnify:CR=1 FL=1|nr:hypothetical protein [Blastopirellula sp.]
MRLLKQLWADTGATVTPTSMLLLVTIVAIGGIVGLTTIRDQIVQEFVDVGVALNSLDHSVNVDVQIDTDSDGVPDTSIYSANFDDNDIGTLCGQPFTDPSGQAPGGLVFTAP